MSYDFWCFPRVADEEPSATAARLMEQEESEEESEPLEPQSEDEVRKKALADAVIKHNPQMTPFSLQYDLIAEIQKITIEEAKKRFRYIELNGPDGGNGIQITLHDEHATITVPYWHQGEQAEAVFAEIWEYLRILSKEGGYITYDPQLERALNLGRDLGAVVNRYAWVVRQVTGSPLGQSGTKKPWWKFW